MHTTSIRYPRPARRRRPKNQGDLLARRTVRLSHLLVVPTALTSDMITVPDALLTLSVLLFEVGMDGHCIEALIGSERLHNAQKEIAKATRRGGDM